MFKIVGRLGARDLSQPLQLLYGPSFKVFIGRLLRLRAMARSMRRGVEAPPLPVRLQIETTDICNFKCRMCTREVIDGMNTKTMSLEQFKSVVDQIAPYYLTMNGLGEPLLDKTIFDKLAYARQSGIVTAMPTNGTYIRGEKLEQLAENMPDILTFSIDGAQKNSFEYVRVLSNFDQVIANYSSILARRARGETRANTRVNVLCALQKANLRDYKAMWHLKNSMAGVDAFNLVPVFDYDPAGKTFAELVPSRQDVREVTAEIDAAIAETNDPDESLSTATGNRRVRFGSRMSRRAHCKARPRASFRGTAPTSTARAACIRAAI